MQTYTSRSFTINKEAETLQDMVKNPTLLQPLLDKYADKVELKNLQLSENSVTVEAPVVGNVTFRRVEEELPGVIKYQGEGTPVPMSLNIFLKPEGEKTNAQISLDADIPAFMGGMIGGKAQKWLGKAADMLEVIKFDK